MQRILTRQLTRSGWIAGPGCRSPGRSTGQRSGRRISSGNCRWYHCITRCVRGAFLLEEEPYSRKEWIERRLKESCRNLRDIRRLISKIKCAARSSM
jgi:hypothetical protein